MPQRLFSKPQSIVNLFPNGQNSLSIKGYLHIKKFTHYFGDENFKKSL